MRTLRNGSRKDPRHIVTHSHNISSVSICSSFFHLFSFFTFFSFNVSSFCSSFLFFHFFQFFRFVSAWFPPPSLGGVAVFPSLVWWCCFPSPPLGGAAFLVSFCLSHTPSIMCCTAHLQCVKNRVAHTTQRRYTAIMVAERCGVLFLFLVCGALATERVSCLFSGDRD